MTEKATLQINRTLASILTGAMFCAVNPSKRFPTGRDPARDGTIWLQTTAIHTDPAQPRFARPRRSSNPP